MTKFRRFVCNECEINIPTKFRRFGFNECEINIPYTVIL